MKFKPSEDLANATLQNVETFITEEFQKGNQGKHQKLQNSANARRRTPLNWDYLLDPNTNPDLK